MTPKEKAIELIEKFLPYSINMFDYKEQLWKAKEMALIVVDEMISQLAEINNAESFNISKYGNYWQEVKTEIENL